MSQMDMGMYHDAGDSRSLKCIPNFFRNLSGRFWNILGDLDHRNHGLAVGVLCRSAHLDWLTCGRGRVDEGDDGAISATEAHAILHPLHEQVSTCMLFRNPFSA